MREAGEKKKIAGEASGITVQPALPESFEPFPWR